MTIPGDEAAGVEPGVGGPTRARKEKGPSPRLPLTIAIGRPDMASEVTADNQLKGKKQTNNLAPLRSDIFSVAQVGT